MKYYARFYGAWNSRFGDFRWHKLAVACANEGVPVRRAHAVEDCRLTSRCSAKWPPP